MKEILKSLGKKEVIFLIITFFAIVGQVWLDLKLPEYMSEITKLVQTPDSNIGDILINGGYMLLCAFGSLSLTVLTGFYAAKVAVKIAQRLREKVYNKTLSFSLKEINKFSTGSLITRSTNDVTQVQTFMTFGFIAFVRAPIMAIWALSKITGKDINFTMITLYCVLALIVVLVTVIAFAIPKSKKLQSLIDSLNSSVREHLIGIRVVRAFNAEKYQEEKIYSVNNELTKTNTFVNRITAIIFPFMTFIMSLLTLLIYWVGAYLIIDAVGPDKLTIFSDMVVFSSYAIQIIMSFMMLTIALVLMPRSAIALRRIREVINTENSIKEGELEKSTKKSDYVLEFNNVSFSFADSEEAVLENISFKIKKGETLAVIGATGSGKSTLINLIPRFFDCTKGEILLNGENIKNFKLKSLRENIKLVTQKPVVFSGNIKTNIAFGKNLETLDQENLEVATKISQSTDFVNTKGYEGEISQSGLNLSGGQKQRLSIARAIYNEPSIYIFDDCFSALDYKTDKVLRHELNDYTEDSTKIIVGQRISTIKDADTILVVDDGKIIGNGTHQDLLNNNTVYQEIAKSQLSKEELGYE